MKKNYFFLIILLLLFSTSSTCYAQQNLFLNNYLNGFGLYSNPSFYSFDDNLFSFSYLYYFNQFNQFSLNIANTIILSYMISLDDKFSDVFIALPLNLKMKNAPLSFGIMVSNIFLSLGYYSRIFGFIESGLTIYFPYNDQFKNLIPSKYEIIFGLKINKNLVLSSNLFLEESFFNENIIFESIEDLKDFCYWQVNLSINLDYSNKFCISYSSQNILQLYFSFYKKFNSFHLSFSIDNKNSSYSFGFSISKNKNYHDTKSKANLYIVDLNEISIDIELISRLKEFSKYNDNIFLFLLGKRVKRITDIEDLLSIIKELKKQNLCFGFIEDVNLFNIVLASSCNYTIIDKSKPIKISDMTITSEIIDNILLSYLPFISTANLSSKEREKIINIIKKSLLNNEKLNNLVIQIFKYLINEIAENKNIDKEKVLNLLVSNTNFKIDELIDLGLINFIII